MVCGTVYAYSAKSTPFPEASQSLLIASIAVADHAGGWIGGQDALQADDAIPKSLVGIGVPAFRRPAQMSA